MIDVLPSIPQVTNLGVHQHETRPCFQIKPKVPQFEENYKTKITSWL
jgi:hypothetical protein